MLVRTFEAVIQIDYLRSELQEYIDELRVKMSTGLFLYQLEALIIGHRLLICSLAGKRIENVSQSHYPCLERYVLTLEAVRISLAVVLLMMVVRNIDRYGNTSSASVPISFDELVRSGKLKKGDLIAMCAFGGGLSSAACILKW